MTGHSPNDSPVLDHKVDIERSDSSIQNASGPKSWVKSIYSHRPVLAEKIWESVGVAGTGNLGIAGELFPIPRFPFDAHCPRIVACGPDSLTFDVRNVVADVQLSIAQGRSALNELYLHTERFGW